MNYISRIFRRVILWPYRTAGGLLRFRTKHCYQTQLGFPKPTIFYPYRNPELTNKPEGVLLARGASTQAGNVGGNETRKAEIGYAMRDDDAIRPGGLGETNILQGRTLSWCDPCQGYDAGVPNGLNCFDCGEDDYTFTPKRKDVPVPERIGLEISGIGDGCGGECGDTVSLELVACGPRSSCDFEHGINLLSHLLYPCDGPPRDPCAGLHSYAVCKTCAEKYPATIGTDPSGTIVTGYRLWASRDCDDAADCCPCLSDPPMPVGDCSCDDRSVAPHYYCIIDRTAFTAGSDTEACKDPDNCTVSEVCDSLMGMFSAKLESYCRAKPGTDEANIWLEISIGLFLSQSPRCGDPCVWGSWGWDIPDSERCACAFMQSMTGRSPPEQTPANGLAFFKACIQLDDDTFQSLCGGDLGEGLTATAFDCQYEDCAPSGSRPTLTVKLVGVPA